MLFSNWHNTVNVPVKITVTFWCLSFHVLARFLIACKHYLHEVNVMINKRDNNIMNIFSYILNVSEAIFHHQRHGLLEYTDGKLQKHGQKWVGHWVRFWITFDYAVLLTYFLRQKFNNLIDFLKIQFIFQNIICSGVKRLVPGWPLKIPNSL